MSERNGTAAGPEVDFARTPPNDVAAERVVLGACLLDPAGIDACAARGLTGSSFYDPRHTQIWHAAHALRAGGHPGDPVAVLDEIRRRHELRAGHLDGPYLHSLLDAAGNPSAAPYYASIVTRLARQRRVHDLGIRLVQQAGRSDLDDTALDDVYADARDHLLDLAPAPTAAIAVPDVDAFLDADLERTHDWLIPGVLERGDRVILTGEEGAGKSHLGRQVAVQIAAGVHPFTGEPIDPARVLLIDLENPPNLLRRQLRPLRLQAGGALDRDRLRIEARTDGIDLSTAEGRDWMVSAVADARPDLLMTGPIYKMADGDPNEEKSAKPVALFLDQLRALTGTAVWLEAHVGNEASGSRQRHRRPFGWSGWRRWPEFGIYLDKDGAITHWRGQRESREWPTALRRGGEWPFVPATDEKELRWLKIKIAREEFGEYMTIRDIADATGIHRSTVSRLIAGKGPYAGDWEMLNGPEQPMLGPDEGGPTG